MFLSTRRRSQDFVSQRRVEIFQILEHSVEAPFFYLEVKESYRKSPYAFRFDSCFEMVRCLLGNVPCTVQYIHTYTIRNIHTTMTSGEVKNRRDNNNHREYDSNKPVDKVMK